MALLTLPWDVQWVSSIGLIYVSKTQFVSLELPWIANFWYG